MKKRNKVTNIEETSMSWDDIKKYTITALAVIVLGLDAFGVYNYFKETKPVNDEPAIYQHLDQNDCVDPIIQTRYVAPEGFILEGKKAVKRVYCNPTATTVDGKTVYSLPEGFTLETVDGKMIGVKTLVTDAYVVTETVAPAGYILVGNKCYKYIDEYSKGK